MRWVRSAQGEVGMAFAACGAEFWAEDGAKGGLYGMGLYFALFSAAGLGLIPINYILPFLSDG